MWAPRRPSAPARPSRDSMIKHRVRAEDPATKRKTLTRGGTIVVAGVIAIVLAYGAFGVIERVASDCRTTSARRAALSLLRRQKDPATGEEIGKHFGGSDFTCAELGAPKGLLIAAHEDGEKPGEGIIWWFDPEGRAHNVNLIAQAWTPKFPGSPEISNAQLRRVDKGRQDE
jgi:hypothetical protein